MKSLVVGGGGFLGSHLVDSLLKEGHEVIVVDNFSTGQKTNLSESYRSPLLEIIRHDINFPLYLEVDEIYNLGSPASPVDYQRDPVQTLKTNIVGTTNLLGLAKRTGAKFFQASTSEIYGDPKISPQHEEYWGNVNPIGIRACYDEGKRAAETLCFDYHRQHGVEIRVARIFNTYGPRMKKNDGRVVSNFIRQALNDDEITIYGDGNQTRSFCFVSDLVRGIKQIMDHGSSEISPANLGNPNEMSMKELAKQVIRKTESKSEIAYLPLPSDDPRQRRPDISKVSKMTGWQPIVTMDDGLDETIKFARLSGWIRS